MGIVEFKDLDIIDPEYNPEISKESRTYWIDRLENTQFSVEDFLIWIKNNVRSLNNTLRNPKLNTQFWKWMKCNVSENLLRELPGLPIWLKDGSTTLTSDVVYFADEYGFLIENIVSPH